MIANAKHYVINSQEHERSKVSENPEDERTLFEIYYPPFEGAVVAGVGSMMCSYNKIHNVYSCENPTTLAKNLKKDLNFNGWVMSGIPSLVRAPPTARLQPRANLLTLTII